MIRKLQDKYPILPEGEQLVRVKEVIDKDYEQFDKLLVVLENEQGVVHRASFNFVNDNGTPNDGAETAYTFMCRALMDDQTLDAVDTDELAGKFALAEVVHTAGSKGGTFANIKKWTATERTFGEAPKAAAESPRKRTAAELLAEARARKAAAGQ